MVSSTFIYHVQVTSYRSSLESNFSLHDFLGITRVLKTGFSGDNIVSRRLGCVNLVYIHMPLAISSYRRIEMMWKWNTGRISNIQDCDEEEEILYKSKLMELQISLRIRCGVFESYSLTLVSHVTIYPYRSRTVQYSAGPTIVTV